MFGYITKVLRFWKTMTLEDKGSTNKESILFSSLESNLSIIGNIFGSSKDVVIRRFTIDWDRGINAAVIFVDGLVNKEIINRDILSPLMACTGITDRRSVPDLETIEFLEANLVPNGEIKRTKSVDDVVDSVLSGDTTILIDGAGEALVLGTRGWEKRGLEEPESEVLVRGPRQGFAETLRVNTALLRRIIRHPGLTFEIMTLGRRTRTTICLAYLKEIVNERLVVEIKRRLKRINIDAILESGYIEQFIEDAPFSPFATVGNSERPDKVAANILEGRAAILVDGTPIVLTVPMVFVESFQSPEDYYSRPYYASFVRWIRYGAFLLSVLSPAIYVAISTFHQELIPTPLLNTIAAAREGTPFPAVVEAIAMILVFEILREAGIRLPRPIGQAVSIVGALVIGQAAVSAGLIGAPMVIVIAITAIASFVVPPLTDAGTILRFIFALLAGGMGGFGVTIGLIGVLVHLASIRSFGVPYLSPLAPLSLQDLKDVIVRAPLWAMITRPKLIDWHDPQRQEFDLMPEPPTVKGQKSEP